MTATGVDRNTAAECAQDALLELARKWQTVQQPLAWSKKVAVRKCYSRIFAAESCVESFSEGTALYPSNDESTESVESRSYLMGLLATLTPRQRHATSLWLEGLPNGEIADEMQTSSNNVAQLLFQARASLRNTIETREAKGEE